jgi:hypothetical protein
MLLASEKEAKKRARTAEKAREKLERARAIDSAAMFSISFLTGADDYDEEQRAFEEGCTVRAAHASTACPPLMHYEPTAQSWRDVE